MFFTDPLLNQLEREYRKARAKYNKAQRNSVKYHIMSDNYNYNDNVRSMVEARAASEDLYVALQNYNLRRSQLGMKPILIKGVNTSW